VRFNFNVNDLTENVRVQDQEFTPEQLAICFVFYAVDVLASTGEIDYKSPLTDGMRALIEDLIRRGLVPSKRQFHAACAASGRDGKVTERGLIG
jgi:hypothetical protein